MNKKAFVGIIVMLIIICGCVAGFLLLGKKTESPDKVAKKKNINPLTGIELKKGETLPDRPIMVSTDNDSYLSRPQAGISKADILYEVPIEGGGSRYEPIYYGKIDELTTMGAVRSVRPYILDIAREYNAVFVHNGTSQQAFARFKTSGVDRIAASENFSAFHQEKKNLKRLPGNFYVKKETILKFMEKLNYNVKKSVRGFKWLDEGDTVSGSDVKELQVNYADGAYNTFKYDEKSKTYTKYVKGKPLIDENNNETFKCSNILIQKVPFKIYSGEKERLDINMISQGEALMFTQGKMVKGTWSRKDENSPTIFKDENGNEFKMTPGVTAIQLVDTTVKVKY